MSVILVTGGNRGIGAGIVQALSAATISNATILVASRSAADAHLSTSNTVRVEGLQLDITQDASIRAAVDEVARRHGKLDVLINNAGEVLQPASDDLEDIRTAWAKNMDCLFTSQVLVTRAFTPLLRKSDNARVIMMSSARGSLARNRSLDLPPSVNWSYDCAKAALNLALLEFRNQELRSCCPHPRDHITFWAVGPGHCRTGFNGFRGFKDPVEGAEVVARLLRTRRGEIPSGTFWEVEHGNFQQIPW
ncbi:hypothetical protein NLU13_8628 [Sarocladium strictum]|uniref:Ketoreductase domain-containing protein n=1 Tax=Sarocladium strictum TaxID=5046 RepID=A0AA39L570_SARSR|nr:hypothetical protein NLU13_8628 [Sarocladium strictum]